MIPVTAIMRVRDKALDRVVAVEGGFVDDAADRGKATCYGITELVARANGYTGDMRDLDRATALAIYKARYWDALRLDEVAGHSTSLAVELFDTAVNQGTRRATEYLQRGLNAFNDDGRLGHDLEVDGAIGVMTMAARGRFMKWRGAEGGLVLAALCNALQGAFYVELVERDPSQRKFAYGWIRTRVAA